MTAQAEQMKEYVSGLVALTGAKGDGGLITTSKELVQHAFQGMKEKRRYVKNRLIAPHREEFKTEQVEEVHQKIHTHGGR